MRELMKKRDGDMSFMLIFLVFFMISISLLTIEIFRIFGINSSIKTELKRACDYAVIEAMIDEHRIDKVNIYDESIATATFYDYLHKDLDLDGSLSKYGDDGSLQYQLIITGLTLDGANVQFTVEGYAIVPSAFDQFTPLEDFRVPFKERSKNMRIDGL